MSKLTEREQLELKKEVARLNLNQYRLFKYVGSDVDEDKFQEVKEQYEKCKKELEDYNE